MWLFLALLVWPLFIAFIVIILLIPFQFTLYSLVNLVTIPYQLVKIALNKDIRRNHALEHATIHVLEERFGIGGLTGLANENGFIIQGNVAPEYLRDAALIALKRLQRGEYWLSVHNRCGTSIIAANFVSSLFFVFLLWQTGMFSLLNVLVAIFAAQLIGPLAGRTVQKYITTSANVDRMQILRVEYKTKVTTGFLGIPVRLAPSEFFVRTQRTKPVQPEF